MKYLKIFQAININASSKITTGISPEVLEKNVFQVLYVNLFHNNRTCLSSQEHNLPVACRPILDQGVGNSSSLSAEQQVSLGWPVPLGTHPQTTSKGNLFTLTLKGGKIGTFLEECPQD